MSLCFGLTQPCPDILVIVKATELSSSNSYRSSLSFETLEPQTQLLLIHFQTREEAPACIPNNLCSSPKQPNPSQPSPTPPFTSLGAPESMVPNVQPEDHHYVDGITQKP